VMLPLILSKGDNNKQSSSSSNHHNNNSLKQYSKSSETRLSTIDDLGSTIMLCSSMFSVFLMLALHVW
jgi:hypothetical protein